MARGLLGEQVSFGGRGARGFALSAAGDPGIWEKLTSEQQTWLANVKQKLNALIVKTTGTTCSTWGPTVTSAGSIKCFQGWYNSYGLSQLRTDGVLDQGTLDALIETARAQSDFPQFPGSAQFPGTPVRSEPLPEKKEGLSTGAMVGIGVAGVAVVGGGIYLATSGGKARKRRH